MTAGTTHHQSNVLKMVLKPESSEPLEESTHTATATRPNPTTTRSAGQAFGAAPGARSAAATVGVRRLVADGTAAADAAA